MSSPQLYQISVISFWFLAFALSLPIIEPYEISRLVAILFSFAGSAVMITRALYQGIDLKSSLALDCALLFWLLMGASIFWSPAFDISFIAFCSFSLLPLGFYSFALLKDSEGLAPTILKAILFIIGGLAIWAITQYLILEDFLVNGDVRIPFANPNTYAALLSLGAFLALGFWYYEKKAQRRIDYVAALILCLSAIPLTGSRGALISLIICMSLFFIIMRKQLKTNIFINGLMVLLPLLLGALFVLFLSRDGLSSVSGLFISENNASMMARFDLWESSIEILKQHFWLGTGIGTFYLFYPEVRQFTEIHSSGLMAHSDPLQFAIEAGIFAPVLFYAFIILSAVRVFKYLPETNDDKKRGMITALFCGLSALILHTHISFNLNIACLLLLCGLMLGFLYRLTSESKPERKSVSEQKNITVLALSTALPLIMIAILLQGFLISHYYAERAKKMSLGNDITSFANAVNKANTSAFEISARPYLLAASIPISVLYSQSALSEEEKLAQRVRAKDMLNKAKEYNPRLAAIYYYLAELEALNGEIDKASTLYKQSLKIDPLHLPSRLKLADIYIKEDKKQSALDILKEGLYWPGKVHDKRAYFNLTKDLALELDDKQTFIIVQRKIAKLMLISK